MRLINLVTNSAPSSLRFFRPVAYQARVEEVKVGQGGWVQAGSWLCGECRGKEHTPGNSFRELVCLLGDGERECLWGKVCVAVYNWPGQRC